MLTACPICGGTDLRAIPFDRISEIEAILARRELSAGYGWYLCRTCGNASPSEQPSREVLAEYWQTNRAALSDPAAWEYRRKIAKIGAERSWSMFAPLCQTGGKPGRFLDIGCGLGATVKRFQDGGWVATGIDADATTKPHHDAFGIKTRIGQIEAQIWTERFDLIQIAYAIYFVTEPAAYLRRLHELLAPDGVLAIVITDHLSSFQKGGPSYLHTWLPTAASLQYALAHCGYTIVLSQAIKGSHFIAAKAGATTLPRVPADLTLLLHRTQKMRWRCIGAPRAALKAWIAPVLAGRLSSRSVL